MKKKVGNASFAARFNTPPRAAVLHFQSRGGGALRPLSLFVSPDFPAESTPKVEISDFSWPPAFFKLTIDASWLKIILKLPQVRGWEPPQFYKLAMRFTVGCFAVFFHHDFLTMPGRPWPHRQERGRLA
jgi:hypothetical protein